MALRDARHHRNEDAAEKADEQGMGRGLAEDRDAIAREGKILRGIEGESDRQPCKAAMEDQQQRWHGPAWKPTDQHQQGQQEQRKIRQQRSEEHTSELQSTMRIPYAVFSWKKKQKA